jgi:hypothetical protein
MLVADMVENATTGERRFLLLQSYMPAQDMHIVLNPSATGVTPWYPVAFGNELVTPEWTFEAHQIKRWK